MDAEDDFVILKIGRRFFRQTFLPVVGEERAEAEQEMKPDAVCSPVDMLSARTGGGSYELFPEELFRDLGQIDFHRRTFR